MRAWTKSVGIAFALAILGVGSAQAQQTNAASTIDGRWDAVLTSQGQPIPFRLDIAGDGATLKGIFYDGSRPNDGTSSATFDGSALVLRLDQYQTVIKAKLQDGKLVGEVQVARPSLLKQAKKDSAASDGISENERLKRIEDGGNPYNSLAFEAVRHVDAKEPDATNVPQIGGSWIVPLSSPSAKGENAFRFVVEQKGAYVEASILRVDGDTGSYSGYYKDGKWVLSHYDGGRPGVIEVSVASDGSLEIQQDTNFAHKPAGQKDDTAAKSDLAGVLTSGRYAHTLTAYRPEVEKAKGLPEPDDFQTHTGVRDPNEIFAFNFPDDQGRPVSNEDPRFKGKVVIAMITGTWCPNCHDEAQYLVQLDKKYRDKGLAIVALDFEEPSQLKSLEREKAFVKHYGVKYTYLIAGTTNEVWEKIPQFTNLNSWPTIIFVGRDGKVKATHTGFASPASGEFYNSLRTEFESTVERLLAESPAQNTAEAPAARISTGK